ncbi:hypothetical protein BV22DRAFT_630135 [Leucogyrophana mollusca]|uniref:Uncharacterized protein n=1 Tax=Leucogyrophana mollusca TaxID=85980 RepID=A0ACB8BC00_9AGAM|nr:hypothetical protein BV22DRAFT_630135 [Leucogyrophana mollusca]
MSDLGCIQHFICQQKALALSATIVRLGIQHEITLGGHFPSPSTSHRPSRIMINATRHPISMQLPPCTTRLIRQITSIFRVLALYTLAFEYVVGSCCNGIWCILFLIPTCSTPVTSVRHPSHGMRMEALSVAYCLSVYGSQSVAALSYTLAERSCEVPASPYI